MGAQLHVPSPENPVVDLPPSLSLPFLRGLTAREIIEKADWFIRSGRDSFERDRDLGLLDYYGDSGHPHDALCCLIPAQDAPRPEQDTGIPHGLAKWILRRQIAEQALPQRKLPMALIQQIRGMGFTGITGVE